MIPSISGAKLVKNIKRKAYLVMILDKIIIYRYPRRQHSCSFSHRVRLNKYFRIFIIAKK